MALVHVILFTWTKETACYSISFSSMSEGKPTGADQSTSNGGGGGTSGDPGGKQGALSVIENGKII